MRLRFNLHILKVVWAMTWPTVTYSVLESLVGLTDVYMVGRLGKDAVAGVGLSNQVLMLVMVTAFAVTAGTTTLVAQFVGAGNREEAGETGRQTLLAMFAVSWIVAIPMVVLAGPALRVMGAAPAVLAHGAPYMRIVFGGIVVTSLNFATSAVFRGAGDMITPLKIAGGVCVLNVGVNYLYIFGPGPFPAMGAAGAAVGTVVSRGIGGVVAVWLLSRPGGRIAVRWANGFRFRGDLLRRMLRIGLPSAGSGLLRNGSRTLFFRVVTATASAAVAVPALVVAFRLRMIVIFPALAFQVAATTLVGQAIGRGDHDQAERLGWEAVKLCTLIMLVLSAIMFGVAHPLSVLFHKDPAVHPQSVEVIRFVAIGQVFSAIAIAASGALAGAGDTRPAFSYTAITEWLLTLPPAYVLANIVGLDASGAWWPLAVAPAVQAALFIRRFAGGKWRHIQV